MRTPYRPGWSVTTILIVSLVACFIVQSILEGIAPRVVGDYLALSAYGLAHGRIWELITFQFLHGGWLHLLCNLVGLYFFGRPVESLLGKKSMLQLYIAGGTIGGLLQMGLQFAFPNHYAGGVVGASAGIFALIAAFATNAPDDLITMLLFFILPVTFPAKVLLIGEGLYAFFGVIGPFIHLNLSPEVAHAAHLGGMLTGIFWIRWAVRDHSFNLWPRRRTEPRRPVADLSPSWKASKKRTEDLPPAEFISREVDPILEKISAHGIHSLTDRERQILEAARNRMAKR